MPVSTRKAWARELQQTQQVSIVLCCKAVQISRTAFYYEAKKIDDSAVKEALEKLSEKHLRWGFPRLFKQLRKEGFCWNHKRVYRVYRAHKLQLNILKSKRFPKREPDKLAVAQTMNQCWSIDFMSDCLKNGKRFRTFNVIDDFNREPLGIDIAVGMPSSRVIRYLDQLCEIYINERPTSR